MIRSVGTLSFVSLFLLLAPIGGAHDRAPDYPHIRSGNPDLMAAASLGLEASPLMREIVGRIESSDAVVYLVCEASRTPGIAAHVSFISAAGGRRYLRVAVDPRFSGAQLIGLLGHELQHAAEIAGEPSVVDERSLAAFYHRVGFAVPSGRAARFESAAAIDAGRRVMRDAAAHVAAAAAATIHTTR
jgi:hypothetical protein